MTTAKHDFKYASGSRKPPRRSARFSAAAEKTFGRRSYSGRKAALAK